MRKKTLSMRSLSGATSRNIKVTMIVAISQVVLIKKSCNLQGKAKIHLIGLGTLLNVISAIPLTIGLQIVQTKRLVRVVIHYII